MGAKKILYKNHCTPQEQITNGGRYYLDSDCGRKLTGSHMKVLGAWDTESVDFDFLPTYPDETDHWEAIRGGTSTAEYTYTGITVILGGDFVSIQLISGDDVTLAFYGLDSNGVIKLIPGEGFSSCIADSASCRMKIPGTSKIRYLTGT